MRKFLRIAPASVIAKAQVNTFASKAKQADGVSGQNERVSDATQTYEADSDFSLPKFLMFTLFNNRATLFPVASVAGMAVVGSTMGSAATAAFGVGAFALHKLSVKGRSNSVVKDLNGKVCVVTGGSRGIGLETTIQLAEMGATVVVAAPQDTKESAMATINERFKEKKHNITFVPLDLAEPNQILAFSNLLKTQFKRVDILVNNAALFTEKFETTTAGSEKQVGVNFLGHFQLTELLIPLLQESTGRVVYVTCSSHITAWKRDVVRNYFSPKVTEEDFHPNKQYGASKLGNILHVEMLKYRGGFSVCSVNPGSCDTGIHKTDVSREQTDSIDKMKTMIGQMSIKNAYEGSQTVVNCCVRDDLETGGHYVECMQMPAGLTAVARSKKEAAELCNWAANHTIKRLSAKRQ